MLRPWHKIAIDFSRNLRNQPQRRIEIIHNYTRRNSHNAYAEASEISITARIFDFS